MRFEELLIILLIAGAVLILPVAAIVMSIIAFVKTRKLKEVRVPVCIVRNKCDIEGNSEKTGVSLFVSSLDHVRAIRGTVTVSAKSGFGISELLAWLTEAAVPEEPGPETVLPFSELFGVT